MGSLVLAVKRPLARARRVYAASLRELVTPPAAPDGLPLPPPALRFLAVGSTNVETFLRGGETVAAAIREILHRNGVELARLGALLDFGVGCGRVLRHWHDLDGVDLHGSDYNARLIDWCRKALPFASFEVNELGPPLPYPAERFDLAYSYSVFTHLPGDLQHAWLEELRRVLRPGGHALVTTHGEAFAVARLSPPELERFRAGELVVRAPTAAGTNPYAAFHPPDYVRSVLASGFDVLEHVPGAGPAATAGDRVRQDVYLLRKSDP